MRPPVTPVTAGMALFRLWRRLPPAQRRMLLQAARTHGPRLAAGAAGVATARAKRRAAFPRDQDSAKRNPPA